jgi:hypothetical protein
LAAPTDPDQFQFFNGAFSEKTFVPFSSSRAISTTKSPASKFFGLPKVGDLVVEMALEDENGTKVFSEKAPLKNWNWSGSVGAAKSDLYMSDDGKLRVDENGRLTCESEERDASIFTPEKGKSYRLSLKIAKGNVGAPQAQLLLMGGGWKAF